MWFIHSQIVSRPHRQYAFAMMIIGPRRHFLFFTVLLAAMAMAKYATFHASVFDLGVILNNIYNVSQGEWWRMGFGRLQPSLGLFALLYQVFPADMVPFFILSFQATLLGLPILGLYKHYGPAPAWLYTLFFPVWFAGLFDLHMDPLAVPLLFGFFFMVRENRMSWAVLLALAIALVKDPLALQTAACGLYLLTMGRRGLAPGALLILFGLGYFFFATHYVLPLFFVNDTLGAFAFSDFSWMGGNPGEIALFLLLHPLEVLTRILSNPTKLLYLGALLGGMALLPLLDPRSLIPALPVLAISLLTENVAYSGISNHYAAGLVAPLTIAAANGWVRLRDRPSPRLVQWRNLRVALLLPVLLVHVVFSPSPLSRFFWSDKIWNYNINAYLPDQRDTMIQLALRTHIPEDPQVSVTAQNTMVNGRLANRRDLIPFPAGTLTPHLLLDVPRHPAGELLMHSLQGESAPASQREVMAEFVVLDLERPWFDMDHGCLWLYGRCQDAEAAQRFQERVRETRRRYETILEQDGFMILKRASSTSPPNHP